MTCPTCNGTRKITLFTSTEDCSDCMPKEIKCVGVCYTTIVNPNVPKDEFRVFTKSELDNYTGEPSEITVEMDYSDGWNKMMDFLLRNFGLPNHVFKGD